MLNFQMLRLLFCAICLTLIISFHNQAHADEIRLAADLWCPYNCDPKSDHPGILVEVAREIFQQSGHTISYSVVPWSRAIEGCKAGKFSGLIGATLEDPNFFIYPTFSILESQDVLVVRPENSWRYSGVSSLKDVTLGVIRDYAYSEELDKYILEHKRNPKLVQVVSGDTALKKNYEKLLAGRLDVFIEDDKVLHYFLNRNGKNGTVISAGKITSHPVYIVFASNDPKAKDYAQIFAEGTKKLKESGRLKEIFERYGLETEYPN